MSVESLKNFDGISSRNKGKKVHQSEQSLDEILDSSSSEMRQSSVLVGVHKSVTQHSLN